MNRLAAGVMALAVAGVSGAQAPPQSTRVAFEAASIRPVARTGTDTFGSWRVLPDGKFETAASSLPALVQFAYGPNLPLYRISGFPRWAVDSLYAIRAFVGPTGPMDVPGLTAALPAYLKSLLEDRFNLKVHLDSRTMSMYSLTVVRSDGRLGPHLRPSAPQDCDARRTGADAGLPPCGLQWSDHGVTWIHAPVNGLVTIAATSSGRLLGAGLGLPVVDHTNLEGYFDFELDLSGFMPAAGEQRSPAISSAAMETAYREQLGLRLERRNEPTSILVIDHLEQPTPD